MGSVLISVDERILQDAMKGTGSEIFILEQDGRVMSAPNNSMIGSTIRLDRLGRIGNRTYTEYKAASVTNEKSGWNIVEFYPLSHYQKTMWDQFWLQVGMVFGVCIVLVSAVLIVIHPVIVSVESVLKAMHRVEEGDFTTRVENRSNMPRFSAASPPKPQNAPCISCFCSPLWKTASDTGCMATKKNRS